MNLLNQVFTEIQETFERVVRGEENPEAAGGDARGAAESAAAAGPRVTKARPRPDGLEFIVEGSSGSYRFLNSMDGIVWIYRDEEGRFREDRLLTVQFEGGSARLIERPAGIQRAPFRATSIPQIVKEVLSPTGK